MMKLCLFGGSFDPVHLGHLLVARAALEELAADRIVFLPAAQSPFKPGRQPAPATSRVQMLRTALAGKPWAEVDEQEIRRGGVSYTVDTLRDYDGRFPMAKLFYLIGEDNVAQLPEWREPLELARLAEFVVIPRPRVVETEADSRPLDPAVRFGFKARYLKGFPFGVSSSEIRARVRSGLPVDELLPPGVGEIITNNRLYL